MYPARELRDLAARRSLLLQRIDLRREQCREAGGEIEAGVRRVVRWGRLLKMGGLAGALGLGWLRRRRHSRSDGAEAEGMTGSSPAGGRIGRIMQWAPVAWRVARLFMGR